MRVRTLSVLLCFALTLSPAEAAGKQVRLAYVEWADAVAATTILKQVLEEKGYTVKTVPLAAAAMWQAVATGDADASVAAWLPVTQAAYYDKLKDRLELLGPNVTGAKIGWVVPAFSPLTSIEDLKTRAAEVDGKVIGIDPGAGVMKSSEAAIKAYGLPVRLVDGSDATMTSALKNAIRQKKDVVVTGWTPHWMFARYELKYLTDPKKVFGEDESVNTIVRKGLKDDLPEVYAILRKFKLGIKDEEAMMAQNEERGAKPDETAAKWIAGHRATVDSWLK
ncbi:glycine betaine/proline transport system substrate-binding protein [Methylobacterium sp. PvP062]|uniref:Glycine betaine/proline transport system substrate-binding protein n=1 Tax=Methylobacterium radiotolerans TaxID=31998 RepID=A0ABV2NMZ6_9HYPH|nr:MULTISPECIES: glycine betaine ABC transporter substrate-binding protein [unclassified Methylobacterium]KTS02093.1 glycine/betaine ABC transporter substrate-binding protein [Methylobacterium radiotolerans]MCX7335695.1 glycine betaine ABC transporter substrate-binding protein [Hyphomicrobiales bacterium]KTS48116.1 glycine/betaine ABC transporter substrate-binding protein [Methylobacterium radiotolerans]MBP2495447.1 glycine betaine/proline transport system substrate-binding protein [Methylobact